MDNIRIDALRDNARFRRIPIIYPSSSLKFTDRQSSSQDRFVNANENAVVKDKINRKSYENFTDIDWNYEYDLFRRYNKERRNHSSKIQQFIHTNSRWLILILSSCIVGVLAIFMDYFSVIIHDWKYGVCEEGLFTTAGQCNNWKSWTRVFLPFTKSGSFFDVINTLIVVLVLSLLCALIGGVIASKGQHVRNNGIPETKLLLSGFVIDGLYDYKVIINKVLSLVVIVASGMWVGVDGPLAHISGGITDFFLSKISYIHSNEAIRRELLFSSVASGVAVAFNAPIAGVMFCLEQISTYFPSEKLMWNAFVCSTMSVSILQLFNPFGQLSVSESFEVSKENNWIFVEVFPFLLLGLMGGLFGIYFNRLNIHFAKLRENHYSKITDPKTLFKARITEILVVVFISVTVSYVYSTTSIPMFDLLEVLFIDCNQNEKSDALCKYQSGDGFPTKMVALLLFTTIQAFLFSAYSFGCYVPGGIMTPSLVIGASMGRFMGVLFQHFQSSFPKLKIFLNCNENSQCISPASYAVVGAGSFFTGVTKMSVTSVILQFELTGALTYVLPIMVGVLFARFVNDLFSDRSIYDQWLVFTSPSKSFLLDNLDELAMPEFSMITCKDILKPLSELIVFYEEEDTSLQDIYNELLRNPEEIGEHQVFYPILKERKSDMLIGYISHCDIMREITKLKSEEIVSMNTLVSFTSINFTTTKVSFNDYLNKTDLTVNGGLSVLTAYTLFDRLKIPVIFVYHTGQGQRLQGIITKGELSRIVNKS